MSCVFANGEWEKGRGRVGDIINVDRLLLYIRRSNEMKYSTEKSRPFEVSFPFKCVHSSIRPSLCSIRLCRRPVAVGRESWIAAGRKTCGFLADGTDAGRSR